MSRSDDAGGGGYGGFPRVSGDEPIKQRLQSQQHTFSPRERG